MTAAALRVVAVWIAVAALVDPAVRVQWTRPLAVDIRALPSSADPDAAAAERVKADIARRLAGAIDVTSTAPAAVVFVGGAPDGGALPAGIPISVVSLGPRGGHVRIVDAHVTQAVLPGQRATVSVELEARDATGRPSVVVVERDGLEIARATHTWKSALERATLTFAHAPAAAGLVPLRVRVLPADGAQLPGDVVDVAVRAVDRRLRVLAWEPRPSWSLTFVRRALEADGAFEVSSLVRSSRGLDTRTGLPPTILSAGGLAPFDVTLVGAPEELTRHDVEALDAYMRDRGGAVVFLPDRAPEGAYRELLTPRSFEEVLLERPSPIESRDGGSFLASEFAVAEIDGRGAILASIQRAGGERAVVTSWPRGAGLVVFSGALDAWRYRGGPDQGFGRFWAGVVASLALASPPALSVSIEPSFAAPGDRLIVRARYRASELVAGSAETTVPAVSAVLVASDGAATPVRLWPSDTLGEYEASLDAPKPGRYDLRVTGGTGAAADCPLLVDATARSRRFPSLPAFVPPVTGGVAVDAVNTGALEAHLRGLPRPVVTGDARPMRSPWWIVPFAAALCIEWGLRRRKGLR